MDLSASWIGDRVSVYAPLRQSGTIIHSVSTHSLSRMPVGLASFRPTHASLWSCMQLYPGGDHRPPAAAEQEPARPEDQAGPRHHGKASHPRRARVQAARHLLQVFRVLSFPQHEPNREDGRDDTICSRPLSVSDYTCFNSPLSCGKTPF